MKIVCSIDSVSRANGGIFEAERRLQQTLQARQGVEVCVAGLRDPFTEADRAEWLPLQPVVVPVKGPLAFGYAPELDRALLDSEADLAYCVGLWKYPSVAALHWARRTGKPMIVAPHGMLDSWALRNSRLKKRIAGWLFQDAHLRRAACIRALCVAEAEAIRAYGLTNPVCVVPNGVDLPDLHAVANAGASSGSQPKVLLYLGRLHPKKNLANLLRAWAGLGRNGGANGWTLVVAGWDSGSHEAQLKRLVAELDIARSVLFPGPQFGAAKAAVYARCDAFILPSLSEGLPMVVLEAWSYAKPVVMTAHCNLPEGFAASAALEISTDVDGIGCGLGKLFEMSDVERVATGRRGRELVAGPFSWDRVGAEMHAVCEWVIGGGPRPSTVS